MVNLLNGKDSRWLQLEVCREFQRQKCSRPDTECKFAHPPANVEVQNGRVTACYDSIKVSHSLLIIFSLLMKSQCESSGSETHVQYNHSVFVKSECATMITAVIRGYHTVYFKHVVYSFFFLCMIFFVALSNSNAFMF